MRILSRYIGSAIVRYVLLTMLVLLGLFTFVNFVDQLASLGKGNYHLREVIVYVLMIIPGTVYELFPMAALLGTVIGLSMLANDSELTVMRASGVSMLQITYAALKMGGIFAIVAMLIGELASPWTETQAQRRRSEALQEDIRQHTDFGLWMRDGYTYVNIKEVLPDSSLLGVRTFEFDRNGRLRSLLAAKNGSFAEDHWLLNEVRQTRFDDAGNAEVVNSRTLKWRSRVTPEILSVFLVQSAQLSFLQLSRYIEHLNNNRQNPHLYELAFWNKIMLPLSVAVMVVLAIPFVFTNVRSGALGRNLFIGIMLGIGFYVVNRGFGYVVIANGLSPLLGATIPVAVFLTAAIVMIRRVE